MPIHTTQVAQRPYTLAEIDQMRAAVAEFLYDPYASYNLHERSVLIEERVRTYMMAGVSADELNAQATELNKQRRAHAREVYKRKHGHEPLMPQKRGGDHETLEARINAARERNAQRPPRN